MSLPSICSSDIGNVLPILSITVTGKQSDLSARLHFIITYKNNSSMPIPISYSPAFENLYNISNIQAYKDGISLGLIDKPDIVPAIPKSDFGDSMELGLLDVQEDTSNRLGIINSGETCQLIFDCGAKSKMINSDLCQTSIKLTSKSSQSTVLLKDYFLPEAKFSVDINIVLSNSVVEVTSNIPGSNFEAFSTSGGVFRAFNLPTSQTFDYSMQFSTVPIDFTKSRPRALSSNRTFTFAPLLPEEVCSKLCEASRVSEVNEKVLLLANAAHGMQLSNEDYITQLVVHSFNRYNGDILTLSKNTETEAITAIQPSAWTKGRYDSVFTPYEGYYINNYLNLWDGRTFPKFVTHNLLLSAHSISCFLLLIFSIVLWALMKKNTIAAFLALIVILYASLNCFFIFRHRNLYSKKLNDKIVTRFQLTLQKFRQAIPPGYVETNPDPIVMSGIFWHDFFYEPGFDLLLRLIPSLSRDPSDPLFSDPKTFRAILLLHRYVIPLIFSYEDDQKMNQLSLLVRCFRKVVTNGLIQGSEEIKSMLEQSLVDALETEEIRTSRPLNMRHFTLDTAGIIELFKSISSAASGRTDVKGEEIQKQFSRLNAATATAERNGILDELKATINNSPYMEYYL
ncbi:hypothetical protein M9Y10_042161 [Tritrichomonas musculus]|uniref:Uncharacterized protein n=1 Tax=Tritrichomonas musculus TaxID=1915356 RepID=A0ABR2K6F3_9EUKA